MTTPDPTLDLTALARAHDPRSRAQLVRSVHRVVRRYCRALLGRSGRDFAPADELAGRIATSLLRERRDDFGGPEPAEAIVYTWMAPAVAQAVEREDPRRPPPSAGPASPERVHEQLAQLPPLPREVLVLRAFVGMTSEQTGRALGVAPEVVQREQARALAALHR
ncbi:MAG TPA: sigma factor-like helix-turn-helix DNA-binding protein [Kineosporiaceae bacterium]|jgi:RNA polymerase sigma-70 factor (ECF subfamily)|nr:sigma factor-like helix-turn-helix DNA-binding protein [Kineosporiaceae bacterium]